MASFALANEKVMLHRAAPLSLKGLDDLWAYAKEAGRGVTWKPIPERYAMSGVQDTGLELPLYLDGGEFYDILRRFVHAYMSRHWDLAADTCASDAGVVRWWGRVNSVTPTHDLPQLNCANLEAVLATAMYHSSAGHHHVGKVAAEIEDPCFMPWAWREGELCGTPRTNLVQQIIMASTGQDQPTILQDYTHMFPDAEDKRLWHGLTAELAALGEAVKVRNTDGSRPRPFRAFETELVETATGI